jgi:hypothetical protein
MGSYTQMDGFPLLTVVMLTLTAAVTATRLDGTAVLVALRRDPTVLGWRRHDAG